jgi:ubiquinone/menaquinone biosynthesis C-methylase UbiE/aminoglycoside phosphotransferase (APT) family kinase protein
MLCRDTDFYYGEIAREPMQQVLRDSREFGWENAMWRFSRSPNSIGFVNYVTSASRAAGKFLLPHVGEGVALDYGCGLGGIAVSLASSFRTVYASDLTYERAAFTAVRAQQMGLRNVRVFCSGDLKQVPLPDSSLDLIVLNGVLEWTAEWSSGNPRDIQLTFLREMRRLLRPTGALFIAIENRTAHTYLRGRREDHTGLRYGALLPRPLANIYSQVMRKRPYRTYTYTRLGYRKLLAEAGLPSSQFFGILPDYRTPSVIVDLADRDMRPPTNTGPLRKRIRNRVLAPLLPYAVHSFGITASQQPGKAPEPFFRELLQHISAAHFCGRPCTVQSYRVCTFTPTVLLHIGCDGQKFIVKLPLRNTLDSRIEHAICVLKQVRSLPLPDGMRSLLPAPVATERYQGQLYSLCAFLPGTNVSEVTLRDAPESVFDQVCSFVTNLGRATIHPQGTWASLLSSVASSACSRIVEAAPEKVSDLARTVHKLGRVREYITNSAPSTAASTCGTHGDFWHGNLLFDDRGKLSGVVDWDRYNPNGLPLADLLYMFVLRLHALGNTTSGNAWVDVFDSLGKSGPLDVFVRRYCDALALDPGIAPFILVCSWLERVSMDLNCGRVLPPSAVKNSFEIPLDYFAAMAG